MKTSEKLLEFWSVMKYSKNLICLNLSCSNFHQSPENNGQNCSRGRKTIPHHLSARKQHSFSTYVRLFLNSQKTTQSALIYPTGDGCMLFYTFPSFLMHTYIAGSLQSALINNYVARFWQTLSVEKAEQTL